MASEASYRSQVWFQEVVVQRPWSWVPWSPLDLATQIRPGWATLRFTVIIHGVRTPSSHEQVRGKSKRASLEAHAARIAVLQC
eukprot:3337843-Amphidinium_carterae.1